MKKNMITKTLNFVFKSTIIVFILLPLLSCGQVKQTGEKFYSKKVGDEFEIIIKEPKDFSASKSYTLVFFPDASIKSGNFILSQSEASVNSCILIGIAHKGDWEMKRQRDFLPSDAGGYKNENFGQAAKFYSFMKEELMPYINKKFPNAKKKVFIGHSFGGLMTLYMSLRDNRLFDHYYALSPSVWANDYELMNIEKSYAASHK